MYSGRVAFLWLVGGAFIASSLRVHAQGRLPVASEGTSYAPATFSVPLTSIAAGSKGPVTGPLKKDKSEEGKTEKDHKDQTDKTQPGDHKTLPGDHKGHAMEEENPLPGLPSRPVDRGPKVSLEELELLALQSNPTLVQSAMQIEASRAKAIQAKLWPNPTIGYIGEQIGLNGTAGEFQGGFIQQEIITAGKNRLSAAKYSQQAQTAEFQALVQQLRVLNGVRLLYYMLLAAERRIGLRSGLLENAIEEYRTTLEEHNIGRKDKAEVLLAQNRRNKAQIELNTEKNRHTMLWRQLAALVGMPSLAPRSLHGNLEAESAPLEWENSLARILQESPELLALKSHVTFEELTLRRERLEPIPNITVRGSVGRNVVEKDTVAGVEVSLPIPLWNRNQGNVRMVQADLERSLADVRRMELFLQKRLASEFEQYQNALGWVQVYQKENLANAEEAYRIYLDQYQKRRLPWPEVVRMHRNWIEEHLNYTERLLDLRQREVAINGLLVGNGLAEPPSPAPAGHIEVDPQPR